MSDDGKMGQRDDEILATLQQMLANQREALAAQQTALALQKTAVEAQERALANQEESIAQQKLAVARQLGHIKLYRGVLLVGVPLVGVLVYIFFRIAGPYL